MISIRWSDIQTLVRFAPDSIHSAFQSNRKLVARIGIGPKLVLQAPLPRRNALSALLRKANATPTYFVCEE